MKQLFALLTLTAVLNFGTINVIYAQDANATEQTAEDSIAQAKAAQEKIK
ncbi:MAG: flagellar motor protein MotA, partial [Flavobacteriales bacterium CG_4_10_14_0_8_um_filter_32_5]